MTDTAPELKHLKTVVVPESHAESRLDVFIAAEMPDLSRSHLQRLIKQGAITLNGKTVLPSVHVHSGNEIVVNLPPPTPAAPQAEVIDLDVVYEDDDLLVINKAAGMVVHPGQGVQEGTLVNALLARPHAISSIGGVMRPGIVHRLDKDTTGLMVVAKNDLAHQGLSADLAERKVSRFYSALALRRVVPEDGTVDAPIGRSRTNRLKMAVINPDNPKPARTHWRIVERFGGISLIECKLDSGRTHQIRVHMAYIGHPIVGDALYGGTDVLALQVVDPRAVLVRNALRRVNRQMLHAHAISFSHPRTGELMKFAAPLPADFQHVVDILRAGK